MILADKDQYLLQQVSKQYPDFGLMLTRLRQSELEKLALKDRKTFSTQKGRVEMLTDLLKHVVTQTP